MRQHETIKQLVVEYVTKWVAAGKYFLPNEHDCLEFIATEAGEALQTKMRLNQNYVRNNPKAASERDIAIELFDVIKMCIVYEHITGMEIHDSKISWSGTNAQTLHTILNLSGKALVAFDNQSIGFEHQIRVWLGRVSSLAIGLIEKLGFDTLEIAKEKLERMDKLRC